MEPQHWHWPQITILSLYGFSLLCAAALDGEPKKGKHSLAFSMLNVGLGSWLLWAGGFFA